MLPKGARFTVLLDTSYLGPSVADAGQPPHDGSPRQALSILWELRALPGGLRPLVVVGPASESAGHGVQANAVTTWAIDWL